MNETTGPQSRASFFQVIGHPLFLGLIGLLIGFILRWAGMVRPLQANLDAREKSLREWERINRTDREAVMTMKTISTEELRKWVATLDEQNVRYAELQSLLHAQELELTGPAASYLAIALIALLGTIGFVAWIIRDGNADAARTLDSAVAVLPSLHDALRSRLGGATVRASATALPPAKEATTSASET